MTEPPMDEANNRMRRLDDRTRWATPGVLSIGAASFGSDAGHELTTSLLPTFLTSTLHAVPRNTKGPQQAGPKRVGEATVNATSITAKPPDNQQNCLALGDRVCPGQKANTNSGPEPATCCGGSQRVRGSSP